MAQLPNTDPQKRHEAVTCVNYKQSIIACSIGNLVEWYGWYTFTAGSLYFSPEFFPDSDQNSQMLHTAEIFTVGVLMRPLGGWLLGTIADRFHRRMALTISIVLMCLGSILIGITPTYQTVGSPGTELEFAL